MRIVGEKDRWTFYVCRGLSGMHDGDERKRAHAVVINIDDDRIAPQVVQPDENGPDTVYVKLDENEIAIVREWPEEPLMLYDCLGSSDVGNTHGF